VKQLEAGFCGRRPQQWPAGKRQLSPQQQEQQHPLLWANGTHDASLKFRPSPQLPRPFERNTRGKAKSRWHPTCYLIFWGGDGWDKKLAGLTKIEINFGQHTRLLHLIKILNLPNLPPKISLILLGFLCSPFLFCSRVQPVCKWTGSTGTDFSP